MAFPNILFYGIPRRPTRGYTAEVIRAMRPEHVVIPCCGSFSLAWTAYEAGVPTRQLMCGDVSLYSTALGNAIMDRDWRLEVVGEEGEIVKHLMTDPLSKAAAVLLMIRILQQERKKKNYHVEALRRELRENAAAYVDQLVDQLAVLRQTLTGLTYVGRDMWVTLDQYREDPNALILVNPPRYDGGYEKMFEGIDSVFDWDEPEYAMFKERDYVPLMELLGESPATSLMYYATGGEDPAPLWGEPWRSVFADKPGRSKHAAINWIIANRSVVQPKINRVGFMDFEAQYPLFDQEVTVDSKIWAERSTHVAGEYYRDLFIHKLEGSLSERSGLILIDGHLLSVVGIHMKNWRQRGWDPCLTYGFTAPHPLYRRIHKLTLMAVTSTWFWEDFLEGTSGFEFIGVPNLLQSTMLTPYPEVKTARGVMKLTSREQMPNGWYKLTYYGEILKRTRQETIDEWLEKYSQSTR